ncbi:hypothetical protein [Eubacterium coprostanoligenes]|uniref:Uncharacterized protein n=1 Tax=Eubacterium coprostanoligenes TaxID=290054 RepID=A0A1T4N6W7_9FIRM|nr:hypothetical protein [Eubacterium coprostanoligenes]SJZ74855.1 hypothetical protein SAMN02745114_01491 [Eubacterium coprostanoligenes]
MSKFKELEEITLDLFDSVVIYTVAEHGAMGGTLLNGICERKW